MHSNDSGEVRPEFYSVQYFCVIQNICKTMTFPSAQNVCLFPVWWVNLPPQHNGSMQCMQLWKRVHEDLLKTLDLLVFTWLDKELSRLASLVNIRNGQKLKKKLDVPVLKVKETTCLGFFGVQAFYTFSVGVRHLLLLCERVLAACGDSLVENRWAIPCKPSENKQMIVRCSIPTISQHTTVFPSLHPNNSPTASHFPLCPS